MKDTLIVETLKILIGFFIALFLNKMIDIFWINPKRQKKILRAIKVEALTNCNICLESFMNFSENGIVLNRYLLETVEANISNPDFIVNTHPGHLAILTDYLRILKLCNKYPDFVNPLKVESPKYDDVIHMATPFWQKNIFESGKYIKRVIDILITQDKKFQKFLKSNTKSLNNYTTLAEAIKKQSKK